LTTLRAYNLLRADPHYRRDAVSAGLAACGYSVVVPPRASYGYAPGDVLVIWNRYGTFDLEAKRAEQAGARVIVMENPYYGEPGQYYAAALNHHNGAGKWFVGAETREPFASAPVAPWRAGGKHVLVLAQRGIGEPGLASPATFARDTVLVLSRITKRRIVVRKHPGAMTQAEKAAQPTLAEQLKDCWAAVTWSSAAGLRAILAGVPTFYMAPTITWKHGASGGAAELLAMIEAPHLPDRAAMLRHTSWAQWRISEIESGRAFAALLSLT
jgi:hypothetical protein